MIYGTDMGHACGCCGGTIYTYSVKETDEMHAFTRICEVTATCVGCAAMADRWLSGFDGMAPKTAAALRWEHGNRASRNEVAR
jgi:hypothetical protein